MPTCWLLLLWISPYISYRPWKTMTVHLFNSTFICSVSNVSITCTVFVLLYNSSQSMYFSNNYGRTHKRKGESEQRRSFKVQKAKQAKVWLQKLLTQRPDVVMLSSENTCLLQRVWKRSRLKYEGMKLSKVGAFKRSLLRHTLMFWGKRMFSL